MAVVLSGCGGRGLELAAEGEGGDRLAGECLSRGLGYGVGVFLRRDADQVGDGGVLAEDAGDLREGQQLAQLWQESTPFAHFRRRRPPFPRLPAPPGSRLARPPPPRRMPSRGPGGHGPAGTDQEVSGLILHEYRATDRRP
jgi:hypothetical protein